jgi:predicted nucleic acid-binding protein
MGGRYLLDSNTVIDYIASIYPDRTRKWLNQLIDEEINVSVITKIEVLSFDPDKDDNYSILVDFFKATNIFELTTDIVSKTIHLRQKQKIKLPDAIIAATALQNGLILISRNIRDFKNIKGLQVIDPYGVQ